MNAEKLLSFGLVAGLAVLGCAGPSRLVAPGSVGLSAWLAPSGYLVIPISLAAIGLLGIWLCRYNCSASSPARCCAADGSIRKLGS